MKKFKVGVLKETKNPPDKRVAITPKQGKLILEKFPNVEIYVQPSEIRAYKDEEYLKEGLPLKDDLSDCDILIGVKEVDENTFIPQKRYMFFSHVAKEQRYNKNFFKKMINDKITLIDYEYLTDEKGFRIVAFGKWAGIVGAYNALRANGLRNNYLENLKPASDYKDKNEMFDNLKEVKLSPKKIVITGDGRVAGGAEETLQAANVKYVSHKDFLFKNYKEAVYTKLEPVNYVKHKFKKKFDLAHFFQKPEEYISIFEDYTKVADIYIPCHFWDNKSPVFFTPKQAKQKDFNIKIVADVSCDIAMPIPSTLRPSIIAAPYYDYNPETEKEEPAFSNQNNITVMAVDNLPGELPRDSSEYFGDILIEKIFPYIFEDDSKNIIERATILKNGEITKRYDYLQDFAS